MTSSEFRYSDMNDPTVESPDFVRRKRHGRVWLFCVFYTGLLGILLAYLLTRGYPEHDKILFCLVIFIVLLLIGHALYHIQRTLDLVMAVEFQNALFSSAINMEAQFTVIIRRDGSAIYADEGFRQFFPEIRAVDDRVLGYILSCAAMPEEAQEKLLDALQQQRAEQFVVDLESTKEAARFLLSVTPLRRPKGFFILQGRYFTDVRVDYVGVAFLEKS